MNNFSSLTGIDSMPSPSERLNALPILGNIVDHGFWFAFTVSLVASPGLMFLLAGTLERRMLWPKEQYYGFLYGDIALALSVGSTAALASSLPEISTFFTSRVWHWSAFLAAVVLGLALWLNERSAYSVPQLLSPTKIWHNVFLYGLLGYWLLGLGIPVLYHKLASPWAWLMILGVCVWLALNRYDSTRSGIRVAHIPFDWSHMRPMLRSISSNSSPPSVP